MRYIYMDNFRGFNNTLIPLRDVTFLVGENSTGKSSFMGLVYLLSNPKFSFQPDFSGNEYFSFGGFSDIVSATSDNKSYVTVGMALDKHEQGNKANIVLFYTFTEKDGLPELSHSIESIDGTITALDFSGSEIKYARAAVPNRDLKESLIAVHGMISGGDHHKKLKYKSLNVPARLPIPFSAFRDLAAAREEGREGGMFRAKELFRMSPMTWLAPIRTRPKRTYDGLRATYTPEGDHTPYILKKSLDSKKTATSFLHLLRVFGEESGLFGDIDIHSFGEGPSNPFEVVVGLWGRKLNLSNVGYGVSQVLPVVVEMLTKGQTGSFAIQQPEVHLHPRAQAALGDLIHYLSVHERQTYLVETHSDYLIDRFRLRTSQSRGTIASQVVYFERVASGNVAHCIPIGGDGRYPHEQPSGFRDFFVNEEISLLDV